jgi:predicted ATPase
MEKCCRVVLTGGPGGGKTTAADLYRREIGDEVVVVPEAATILYLGGFPRLGENGVRRATQRAIYHVQLNLEDAQSAHYKSRVLLCDRGSIDGAVYWPTTPDEFFQEMNTSLEKELSRYDAVLFFETAAVGGISIEGGNPARIESIQEALELDRKLKALWSQHPNFVFVPHEKSFIKKVNSGMQKLSDFVLQHQRKKINLF